MLGRWRASPGAAGLGAGQRLGACTEHDSTASRRRGQTAAQQFKTSSAPSCRLPSRNSTAGHQAFLPPASSHILVRFSFLKHARRSASVSLHTPQYLANGLSSWHLCSARICCRAGRAQRPAAWSGREAAAVAAASGGGDRRTRAAAGAGRTTSSHCRPTCWLAQGKPPASQQAAAPPCSSGAGGFRAADEPSACEEHGACSSSGSERWKGGRAVGFVAPGREGVSKGQ